MLNHITLMGRLTRDPELRTTNSGTPVASFTIAVDRDFSREKEVDFIDCVAWRQTGEFVSKYFQKGSMIVVSGSLQSRKWQDRYGNKRVSWEVNAQNAYFGEARRNDTSSGAYAPPSPQGEGYRPAGGPVNVAPPEFDGFRDMPPGTGQGNPFTEYGDQDMFGGKLPF